MPHICILTVTKTAQIAEVLSSVAGKTHDGAGLHKFSATEKTWLDLHVTQSRDTVCSSSHTYYEII